MAKKIILVTGATGNQGGAVLKTLIEHGGYEIRALTRDVESEFASALAAKGIKVVPGQLGDKESMMKACEGVYAVFGVSIPAMAPGVVDEKIQGSNLVDACKANGVQVLVWSSLPSPKETSGGRFVSPVFDDKVEVEKYIKSVGQPAVVFRTGGFTSNLLSRPGWLTRDEQDPSKYHVRCLFVSAKILSPYTYVEKDLGPAVVASIDKWENPAWRAELTKEPIPLASYEITGDDHAAIISKITGKEVDFAPLSLEHMPPSFQALGKWCDEELWGYGHKIPVDILSKLGVNMHTFEDYVREEVVPWMNSQG